MLFHLMDGRIFDQERMKDGGIVDQQVDAAETIRRGSDCRIDGPRIADIASKSRCHAAMSRDHRIEFDRRAGQTRHARTCRHQRIHEVTAHPLGCSSHDCNSPL